MLIGIAIEPYHPRTSHHSISRGNYAKHFQFPRMYPRGSDRLPLFSAFYCSDQVSASVHSATAALPRYRFRKRNKRSALYVYEMDR